MRQRVAIIGGGITGLSAAYYLEKRAAEQGVELDLTLVESSGRIGGKIVTDRERDFIVEGGPDSFITDKPWCLALCHELGLGEMLIPNNQKDNRVYVLSRGRLVRFPAGFKLGVPAEFKPFLLSPLISPLGKLRMAMDYFLPPRPADGDESLGSFFTRRLGREAVDTIAGPLMAGIFVSDPDRLSMKGTFPMFLEMEKKYGSLIKAVRQASKKPRERKGPPAAGNAIFNTLKGGLSTMVDALGERVGGRVLLETSVSLVRRDGEQLRVTLAGAHAGEQVFDHVVLAVPARAAAPLVEGELPGLAARMQEIRYVSTATVSLGYMLGDIPENRPLDGFGVMIPPREKRRIIACTWASTKFKHRAPPGCVLLRAFIGGYSGEALVDQDEDALVEMVRAEYRDLFGIAAEPMQRHVYKWVKGNPQYDVGHLDRVAAMETLAAAMPGLHLAGSSYHGIGMPDCIKSALKAVDRILPAAS